MIPRQEKEFEKFKSLSATEMKSQLDAMARDFDDYQYNDYFDFEDREYFKMLKEHYAEKLYEI